MKCAQTFEIGVYVLGALAPAERDAFERHLSECEVCREEVADLAVLPGLLGRLDLATATAVARDGEEYGLTDDAGDAPRWAGPTAVPDRAEAGADAQSNGQSNARAGGKWAGPTAEAPQGAQATQGAEGADTRDSNVFSLLDAAQRRRNSEKRRRRVWFAAGALAAACLAVVVGLGVPRLFTQDKPSQPALTAMAAVPNNRVPITAEVGLVPTSGGSRVTMRCRYMGTSGERWAFNLVVVPRSGEEPEQVANWTAGEGDDIQMSANSRYAPAEIARIDLRRNDGTLVLQLNR